jgi:hypothetical protein
VRLSRFDLSLLVVLETVLDGHINPAISGPMSAAHAHRPDGCALDKKPVHKALKAFARLDVATGSS